MCAGRRRRDVVWIVRAEGYRAAIIQTPDIGVIAHTSKQLGRGLPELRHRLEQAGLGNAPWAEIRKSRFAPEHVRNMADSGVERIIVWGGDGTVRRCVHTLVDEKLDRTSLAILPAGTANLLAKNLGIPSDLGRAVDIALEGVARPLDVGKMNGAFFCVMGGVGFDALLIRNVDERRWKDRFGRAGYVAAAARSSSISSTAVSIDVDGQPWFAGDVTCVLTANVSTTLGGIEAFPAASPVDGLLELGVIQARTRTEWLRLAGRAVVGRADRSPFMMTTSGRRMTIVCDRALPWEVDGGDRPATKKYKVRCIPGAVRIVQPEP